MKSVMQTIGALLRLAFSSSEPAPAPHPIVQDVERAALKSEKESERVDEFAALIHGMRNHGRKKRQQSGRVVRR